MWLTKPLLRFPRLDVCVLCVCLLATSGLAGAASSDTKCVRLELEETLVSEGELEDVDTDLKSIVKARLGRMDPGEDCYPINDTYLVGLTWNGYPRILSVLDHLGHTPSARIERFEGEDILLVFYSAGGNAYLLQPYRFPEDNKRGIERLGVTFYSNLKSIEVADGMVVERYTARPELGKWMLTTASHRYEDGEFVPVAKLTEFYRYDEENEESVLIEGKTESYRYEDGEFVPFEDD